MATWINFRKLRTQLQIRAVAEYYGVSLAQTKSGQLVGGCPLPARNGSAQAHRPSSFSAHADRGRWRNRSPEGSCTFAVRTAVAWH